jgi:hypothetical protein
MNNLEPVESVVIVWTSPSGALIYSDLTQNELEKVRGVNVATHLGGDRIYITVSPRYSKRAIENAIYALVDEGKTK